MTYNDNIKLAIKEINKLAGFEFAKEYQWKPIVNFEDSYKINECGIAASIDRFIDHYRGGKSKLKGKLLSSPLDRYGYRKLVLFKNNKRTDTTVHRQVALTFIPNPLNLPEVNHKDGDKLNNYYKNLEWCTTEYNLKHAHEK